MRGRPFGFLGTLCALWITARVGFLSALPVPGGIPHPTAAPKSVKPPVVEALKQGAAIVSELHYQRPVSTATPSLRRIIRRANGTLPGNAPVWIATPTTNTPFSVVQSAAKPIMLFPLPPPADRQERSALNIYAYSFVRGGGQAGSLAGAGQYGGSQSGFVATYTLDRFGNTDTNRFSLLVRGAVAHDEPSERELAAGLRLRPLRHLPLTLTAERRFRNARPDAFAVYLAGGKSGVPLPLEFRLDAFAQAGIVSGKDGGPFFDIATRAERKIASVAKTPVTLGAGIWGGGQKDIFRIDVGPTIGTEIPAGETRLRINADWRFRIAGNARPASGPALTLSTSF